jgi:hypothetical protein
VFFFSLFLCFLQEPIYIHIYIYIYIYSYKITKIMKFLLILITIATVAQGRVFTKFKEQPKYCNSLKKDADPNAFDRRMSISYAGRAIKRGILKKDSEYIASVIEAVESCSEGTCGLPTLKKLFKHTGDDEAEKEEEAPKTTDPEECAKHGDNGKACIANPNCNFNVLANDGEGCFLVDESNSPSSEWFDNVRNSIFKSNDVDSFADALAQLKKLGSKSGACPVEEKIIKKAGAEIIKASSSSSSSSSKKKKVKKVLKKQKAAKKDRKPNCAKYDDSPKRCVKIKGCKYNLIKGRCKGEGGWFRL